MIFRQLFDPATSTYSYLLGDEGSREAVIVDPVLEQVDRDLRLVEELELRLVYALDTHVHADHVTALGTLRDRAGCKTVLSERAGTGAPDVLVKDGDLVRFGAASLEVRETPGHTDGCVTYVDAEGGRAFTGDALLVRGCGRTDFQQGDARTLWRSVHERILSLPDGTLLYPGHDYQGRTVTTVREEKRWNPRLGGTRTEGEFVAIMDGLQLARPKQIDVALPANLSCGVPLALRIDAGPPPSRRWAPVEVNAAGLPEVPPEWLAAHVNDVRVVDVREPDEWDGPLGHIAEAELAPLATVGEVAAGWRRDAPIVLVCRSGGRSGKAALQLQAMGFSHVASMRGGMTRWRAQKLPVAEPPVA